MSAILHCVITSIENDRIRENLKVWKDNSIQAIKRMETQVDDFWDIVWDMPNITPYFSLLIDNDEIEPYYYDNEWRRDELYEDIMQIIKYKRDKYKGQEIIVKYCTYSECGEETIRVVFRMLIE